MIGSFTEEEYNYVVMQIIGEKKAQKRKMNSDDDPFEEFIPKVIKKIRDKLENSPMTIFPFIESCTRNAYQTHPCIILAEDLSFRHYSHNLRNYNSHSNFEMA